MRLDSVELRRIRMELVSPFRTSTGTEVARDVLLLKVVTDRCEGWGECAAPAEPVYTSEYVAGCEHVLRHHLLPRLFRVPDAGAADVAGILRPVRGHRMAKAAIEMAILDAELRARAESFARYLGGVREMVDCGVSVGIQESIEGLLDVVEGHLADGYRRVKLKIEPGWDIEPVRAVRTHFPETPLQVDANGAYTPGDAGHLARLDEFDLLMIEQPLPDGQLRAHASLASQLATPICLDESIVSAQTAADAIAMGACAIVNVKPARVGGYLEARRIHDLCQAQGVPVWCGGMLETGLGRAGNVALASLPGFTLPGDLSASSRYFHRDITEPFVLEEGRLRVPAGPGLGVAVDEAMLNGITTSVEVIRPGRGT